jgi:hypothetical protein
MLALDQLRRAVDLAGPDDSRPQFEIARAEIESLEAEQANEDGNWPCRSRRIAHSWT